MNARLLQLLKTNRHLRAAGQAYVKFEAEGDETTLYLYDAIVDTEDTAYWWGGVAAETLVPQIRAIRTPKLNLRINSPGGDAFAGQAIAQAIRDTKAHVTAHVDGYAASAATTVANAAGEVVMSEGSFYMIHNSWTLAIGNADELTSVVELMRKVDGTMAAAYAKRSGQETEKIQEWMRAETWFTAQEAVDAGLANRVAVQETDTQAAAQWNLSAYQHAPGARQRPAGVENDCHAHRDRQAQRLRVLTRAQIG
jgi:ATP-dependent Clp protease protease subunit